MWGLLQTTLFAVIVSVVTTFRSVLVKGSVAVKIVVVLNRMGSHAGMVLCEVKVTPGNGNHRVVDVMQTWVGEIVLVACAAVRVVVYVAAT